MVFSVNVPSGGMGPDVLLHLLPSEPSLTGRHLYARELAFTCKFVNRLAAYTQDLSHFFCSPKGPMFGYAYVRRHFLDLRQSPGKDLLGARTGKGSRSPCQKESQNY
jgi:hypothetical protein